MPADLSQFSGVVSADVKDRRFGLGLEGIKPNCEDRELASTTSGLVQAARIGIEACRRIGIDTPDMRDIFAVRAPRIG